ncbi:GNAT family N-acetyltransferase [Mesobacillus subterraneus]|uniref:GNAT family N-acetyltransferase n=1 Tax=Mesobacillus subterraneus TaxID=285983 RepID=A0A427TVE4_9BACI|nr:GNAT family N-acetyltransferase [Mesobacillus subterraneus]RSD28401.1 GNAT family N-acetyltransferase [Mesobacillus subterraneus]
MTRILYEKITPDHVDLIKDLCNELMVYQKSLATIAPERFDSMSFETRMLPSVENASANFILVAKDGEQIVGYVYSNVSPKDVYSSEFATFFDMDSVKTAEVGCLSQFYIKEGYRSLGIGSVLFEKSMEWLDTFPEIEDRFIYVSNGNEAALNFYISKGFKVSHQILDGFITVLRNT